MIFHYGHGRYGYWRYIFKWRHADFELIAFDASEDHGPVVESETSINFLTHEKEEKVNTNEKAEHDGDEIFKTTHSKIKPVKLLKLSQIKDFDKVDLGVY